MTCVICSSGSASSSRTVNSGSSQRLVALGTSSRPSKSCILRSTTIAPRTCQLLHSTTHRKILSCVRYTVCKCVSDTVSVYCSSAGRCLFHCLHVSRGTSQ